MNKEYWPSGLSFD